MRALARGLSCLPWDWMRGLGAALGVLAGTVLRIRRRHVEESLLAAGIFSAEVAPRVYRSLGIGVFELLWLAGRRPEALDPLFTMSPEGDLALRRAAAASRGVVVATAHTGNWDLTACAAARWLSRNIPGARLLVVTKRLSWKALDRYWQHLRAERGVVLAGADGAVSIVRETLGAGGVVALLVDQAPERESAVATLPFLGRPARHDLGPVLLAAKARAPLLVMLGRRTADGRHQLDVVESLDPADLRGGRGATERAAARIAAAVERFVRSHPDQWLWLHRRWKPWSPGGEDEISGSPPAPPGGTAPLDRRHAAHP
jgi:KDO2-lipid IV(A) lauroyltransferase